MTTDKSLGQHWLFDQKTLYYICQQAALTNDDVVLEIGPGLGTLTIVLTSLASRVIAVEFDPNLASQLPSIVPAPNLDVIKADILKFDLNNLPKDYKVVANLPYYITAKIVRLLLESNNQPISSTILVQKEVAERMAAKPGKLSILGVATQFYTEPVLGRVVPPEFFTPPPKVDSQVITLKRRENPLFTDVDKDFYFRIVRAGFAEKRKKLRSSLSGGLHLNKNQLDSVLQEANIPADARAQELSLEDWHELSVAIKPFVK